MTEQNVLYTLSINTKIDDFGWPWIAQGRIFSEFRAISQIC